MKRYYEIWPMDDWSIQHVCQMTGLRLNDIKLDILKKQREGIMAREGDGPFYLKNLLNQALRDQNFNIRIV